MIRLLKSDQAKSFQHRFANQSLKYFNSTRLVSDRDLKVFIGQTGPTLA